MAGSRRLLVVEDDPGLNALVTRKLQQAGFKVESALTGAAALESLRRDPNALLLLDYLLSDMTAHDVLDRLKADGQEAPFVVMTGHGDEKVAVELMKLGALDYLIKDTDLGIVLPEVMRRAFRMVEAEERLATTEATLRVSEERFRTTFENASVGMSLTMLDTRFITVNRAFSGMLGYTEQELAGRNTGAVTHPDDAAMSQEAVRSLLAGEVASSHLEKRYLHKDGHVIWADLSTSLVRDADGAPLHFIELIQDITEHRRAEQILHESEQRYRTLAQNIPAIVYRVHLRNGNRMEFFNDMLREMTGYCEDELRQGEVCSIDPLILPDDRATVVEIVKRSTDESRPFQVDYRITHRNGSIRHFSEQGRPVPGADGRPEYIDGVVFDATEVRLSAEIVKLNQERLAEAQRTSHLGSWLWDIRAQQSFWSAELFRILGLEPDSVPPTQESFLARVHPDDRAYFEARAAEATRNRTSYDYDLRVVRPDGTERFIHGETKAECDAAGELALIRGTCQDITERKQAEVLLSASEERLRTITGAARDAIIMMDDPGFVTFWNPAAEAMFGYTADEAIGRKLPEFLAPERFRAARAAAFDGFRATGEGGAVGRTIELAAVRKDGSEIPVELSMSAVESGGKWHAIGLARDISARKLAEETLRVVQQRREQLESIVDRSPAVAFLWRTDPQLTVDFVSANVSQFGYEVDEFLSGRLHYIDIIHPEDRGSEGPKVAQYVAAGTVEFVQEYRIFTKAGEVRWVEDRTWVPRDPDGSVSHHQGIIVDVTARRQAEQALRESEERYRNLFTNAPIGMYRTRPDGTVLVVNPALVRMMRYGSAAELLQCNLESEGFSPRFDRAKFKAQLEREGEMLGLEAEWVRADGSPLLVRENARVVRDAKGQVLYYEGTIEDITERKRAADALARQYKLTEALIDSPEDILIFALDRDYRYTAFNEPHRREIRKVYGVEIKVGMDMLEVIDIPEVRQKAKQSFDRVLAGENFTEVQEQPGLNISYEFTWNPIRTGKGKVVGIAAFIRDITERRQAERKLRRYSEDMALLNRLDAAINRGESLDATIALLASETRKSFGGRGTTLFLLSEDRQYLELMNMGLSDNEVQKVEQVLGVGMPEIRVALKPGGFHTALLEAGQARILSEVPEIERWATEMTDSPLIRRLVPALRSLLRLDSVMLAPLVSSGRPIGQLVAARHEPFHEPDLKRFSAIAEQMAVAIGRKLADDALKASEEKYRLVVEHANEAILVHQDERVRFANSRTREVLGRGPEEIQDQPFPQFIHPDDRTEVIERYQKRLRGEPVPERYTFRVVRKDGAIRRVEGSSALTEWRGQPATVSFLSDVTERELAAEQEALRRRDKAFLAETAVEFVRLGGQYDIYQHICSRLHMLVGDAYVVVNSHDLKTGEFQVRAVAGLGNRLDAVLKLMGGKPEGTVFTLTPEQQQEYATDKLKHITGGLTELSFGKLPKRLTAALVRAFNVGDIYVMTLLHQGAILGSVNILLRRETVLSDPEVVETFVNQSAVALQRRLAEDELRRHQQHLEELVEERTKELEQVQDALVRQERLAATGKVAGSMAHEIRNPLAAMRNATYFLTDSLGPKLDGKEARHLEIVNHEIDVANSIITSVLDFARGRPAEMVPLNLTDVLDTAQERANLPRGIQVQRDIPSDLPMVRVDLQQMVQVFLNLLVNASQAMDGEGRITVLARESRVRRSEVEKPEAGQELKSQNSEVKSDELMVEVRFHDEGPGIAPENLKRVFEPLFSTKAVGIGMGLTVCKAFVESCHGTIEVESEPGKGTTFAVTLPAVSGE